MHRKPAIRKGGFVRKRKSPRPPFRKSEIGNADSVDGSKSTDTYLRERRTPQKRISIIGELDKAPQPPQIMSALLTKKHQCRGPASRPTLPMASASRPGVRRCEEDEPHNRENSPQQPGQQSTGLRDKDQQKNHAHSNHENRLLTNQRSASRVPPPA